jgi:hypothetical protein
MKQSETQLIKAQLGKPVHSYLLCMRLMNAVRAFAPSL